MKTLDIDLPVDVWAALGEDKVQSLAREALVVRLYELGELSSGKAAQIPRISRREFLDLLGQYNVSIFDDGMNLD